MRGTQQKRKKQKISEDIIFEAPKGYDSRLDHMINFFEAVRTGKPVLEDASFGLRAAGPAILCNKSVELNSAIHWDAKEMKVINTKA